MSKVWERITRYFYIPPKAKLGISRKNMRICTIGVYFLFALGVYAFIAQYINEPGTIYNLILYASYIVISIIFLIVSRCTKKKDSYILNEILLIMTCTFVSILMYTSIAWRVVLQTIINFYFAIVVMIVTFELSPLFYTVNLVVFFFVLLYFDSKTTQYGALLHVNNALFCSALIFFSFYKRKLISVRELNRLEIEEKNRQLSVQNIELSRQKYSLLKNKQYLEDAAFTQAQELQLQKERIISIQNNTIMSLSNLVENRDEDTGDHVLRTRDYVQLIATEAFLTGEYPELNETQIELFIKAAPMHDIGKIVVPDAVLKKPGKLTPEEFRLIKLHTTKGGKIVSDVLGAGQDAVYVNVAKNIATYHHEKYDGSGYPYGLRGNAIPLSARIMAIADVFDALVSPRCYKEPMPVEKAFSIIEAESGTHFDPKLAALFLKAKDEVIEIKNRYYEK